MHKSESTLLRQEPLRLQKYLASCGIGSRRKCEDFIAAGRVGVNGAIVTEMGVKVTPGVDVITFDKKTLGLEKPGLVLLHKPDGVISSKHDMQGRKTVMDCLPKRFSTYFPVGRLDYETTGLMIFTNDGELGDLLLHPRYEVTREYEALVFQEPTPETLQQMAEGVELEDGLAHAQVKVLRREPRGYWLRVKLSIGRNRIVRRLLKHMGHKVHRLVRVSHGPFFLGNMGKGTYFELSDAEYQAKKGELLRTIKK